MEESFQIDIVESIEDLVISVDTARPVCPKPSTAVKAARMYKPRAQKATGVKTLKVKAPKKSAITNEVVDDSDSSEDEIEGDGTNDKIDDEEKEAADNIRVVWQEISISAPFEAGKFSIILHFTQLFETFNANV